MGRGHGDSHTAAAASRSAAVQKHRKTRRYGDRAASPSALVAKPDLPKSKHKTILEWTENTDKKKKLEIEVTNNKKSPPNFTFIPIGNPELTNICKELSRERGALVYIVSSTKEQIQDLRDHVHRLGYHFRTQIVEEAIDMAGDGVALADFATVETKKTRKSQRVGDPIPKSQADINKQADAALRDLFPRIPNTDREMIIQHAFQKGAVFNGKPVVGLQEDLTLSRRVQLAVLAHIRHTHTRYDLLLRETTWEQARKTVEPLCLDILVKWRGDEETGRDQLDEILREIVVIDDSDDEEEEEDDEEESDSENGTEEDENPETEEAPPAKRPEVVIISSSPPAPRALSPPISRNVPLDGKQYFDNEVPGQSGVPAISSRTRSKTNPSRSLSKKKKKKAKQRKRQKAWQDALNRRNQPPPPPKTPMEQPLRADNRQALSPRTIQNHDFHSPSNPNLPPDMPSRPYDQAIYAIDDRQYQSRRRYLPPSQPLAGPSTSSYREQVTMRPRPENMRTIDQSLGYDSRPTVSRPTLASDIRAPTGFVNSARVHPIQDRVLPSIEQPVDLMNERASMRSPPGPGRHSQVTYSHLEPERRVFSTRPNIIYVDDPEQQFKRRRVILDNGDLAHIPTSSGDGYLRQVPRSEHLPLRNNESHQLVRVMRAADRGHPNEHPQIISDDGRHFVRVIRRDPESDQTLLRQPPVYSSYRADDPVLGSEPTSILPLRDQRPLQTIPHGRFIAQDRPNGYQRAGPNTSTSISSFPTYSESHSHELNSGLVSYPISRQVEPESRFSSARNESLMVAAQPSRQFPPERFPIENVDRSAFRREALLPRQSELREIHRDELQYQPVDQHSKVREPSRWSPVQGLTRPPYRTAPRRDDGVVVLD